MSTKYVTNQATRIIVKAAGELSSQSTNGDIDEELLDDTDSEDGQELGKQTLEVSDEVTAKEIDIEAYTPNITADRGWLLNELDLGIVSAFPEDAE